MIRISRNILAAAACALFVVILVIGGTFLPYRNFQNEVFVDIQKGTSAERMGRQLARAGVVRYSWQFLVARALNRSATLQAGEYRFTAAASVRQVFDRIARGDVFFHDITVPEGSNVLDIASIVGQSGLIASGDFLEAAADVKLVRDLDPAAQTLEGYLFPSTYRITRRTTAEQLVRQMVEQFRKEWKALTAGQHRNVHDIVALASLVEKETAAPGERPAVASVYANRLRIGMKLDCDPTTIYAALIEDRYRGKIHRSDLASRNAYNTYQHPGLPPGAIANPGLASLQAALAPADTKYLYFVARPDGSGRHQFSTDLAAHQRAVQEYRHGQSKERAPR